MPVSGFALIASPFVQSRNQYTRKRPSGPTPFSGTMLVSLPSALGS